MSLISDKVEQIKEEENLTTSELFTKYPPLADQFVMEYYSTRMRIPPQGAPRGAALRDHLRAAYLAAEQEKE